MMITKSLKHIYEEHTGKVSDKWSIYFSEYERIFSQYRHEPICLLEIGSQNGGSLEILAKYFKLGRHFVGADINPDCAKLVFDDERIRLVVGDVNVDNIQTEIKAIVPSFDIIIDDGSHRSSDIVKTFARYFPMLLDGGVFIVEDLHCSYWDEFEGGLFDPYSSLAFFKKLTDVINHESWGIPRQRQSILKGFFSTYDILIDEETLQHVHSIEFINSMCVIRKLEFASNVLGPRIVVGEIATVVQENKDFHLSYLSGINQSTNSKATLSPEDELKVLNIEIKNLIKKQESLNAALITLQQESTSFGSIIGRVLDRLLTRFTRGGARRHLIISRLTHFASILESSGTKVALNKVSKFILKRFMSNQVNLQSDRIEVSNHPELSLWFDIYEPNQKQLAIQTSLAKQFQFAPLISTIIPVYKVPREVLNDTLLSLENQTYSNWQACIVWADTEDLLGWEWLKVRTATDQRFKIKLLKDNGGISINSNSAFELVDGEFIALLDHDDTLSQWAFFEVVKLLQSRPELDFVYSDKDSIRADGLVRTNALFKPEWSPEMLYSVNYLTHLNVIRTCVVREVGGWRSKTDGAQDWDLFLRITERTKNIARVASILYHWRILPTSTASGLHVKPYAALAQLKTLQDHFKRCGLAAAVIPSEEGMFKICWLVPPRSIDVVVYQTGTFEQLKLVLAELMANEQSAIRRIDVIHNNTSVEDINSVNTLWQDRIFFTYRESVDWYKALKVVTTNIKTKTLLLLDGGISKFSTGIVEELGGWITEHPDISWASALAMNADESVYEAGRVVSTNGQSAPLFNGSHLRSFGWLGGPLWYRNTSACSPYAVALKADIAARILSQHDENRQGMLNFSKFCQQLANEGRRGLINPFARVYFEHSPEKDWVNEGAVFHSDPYFNPAFSQVSPLRLHPLKDL